MDWQVTGNHFYSHQQSFISTKFPWVADLECAQNIYLLRSAASQVSTSHCHSNKIQDDGCDSHTPSLWSALLLFHTQNPRFMYEKRILVLQAEDRCMIRGLHGCMQTVWWNFWANCFKSNQINTQGSMTSVWRNASEEFSDPCNSLVKIMCILVHHWFATYSPAHG